MSFMLHFISLLLLQRNTQSQYKVTLSAYLHSLRVLAHNDTSYIAQNGTFSQFHSHMVINYSGLKMDGAIVNGLAIHFDPIWCIMKLLGFCLSLSDVTLTAKSLCLSLKPGSQLVARIAIQPLQPNHKVAAKLVTASRRE